MDLVLEAKQKRLAKIKQKKDLHGWLVQDDFLSVFKVYKNHHTNTLVKVSCVTQTKDNPYNKDILVKYVGIVHEYKYDTCENNISSIITNIPPCVY